MKIINLIIFNLLLTCLAFAQTKEKMVLKGNNAYEAGMSLLKEAKLAGADTNRQKEAEALIENAGKEFSKAEVNYKKAKENNREYLEAEFNLGDALHKQSRYDDSRKRFEDIISRPEVPSQVKGGAYHNIGNSYLEEFLKDPQNKSDKLDESIESYKNALRKNPGDSEARYNLEFVRKLKQQQQQKQQDQDQKQKKDQDQKEEQKQEKQQQEEKEGEEEQQKKEAKKDELSKEEAERMLEALKNKEEKLQEKRKDKKVKGARIIIEKDW